jgi:putative transcription factor
MSKKFSGNSKKGDECPVCGGIIWGRGQRVIIEGARMTVCHNCAQHGTKVSKKPMKSKNITRTSYISGQSKKSSVVKPKPNIIAKQLDEDVEIVADFAKIIRIARNAKKLNQDQFAQKLNEKPSLLRRIESGKVKPTIKLAKKIEKVYGISLIKESDQVVVDTKKYMKRARGTSLGDIAFVKKKK